jgi:hypothetical protein
MSHVAVSARCVWRARDGLVCALWRPRAALGSPGSCGVSCRWLSERRSRSWSRVPLHEGARHVICDMVVCGIAQIETVEMVVLGPTLELSNDLRLSR